MNEKEESEVKGEKEKKEGRNEVREESGATKQ